MWAQCRQGGCRTSYIIRFPQPTGSALNLEEERLNRVDHLALRDVTYILASLQYYERDKNRLTLSLLERGAS